MTEIEKIKRYIARETIANRSRYGIDIMESAAIKQEANGDMLDAVYMAFMYGRAKGYRAAKAEQKAVAK